MALCNSARSMIAQLGITQRCNFTVECRRLSNHLLASLLITPGFSTHCVPKPAETCHYQSSFLDARKRCRAATGVSYVAYSLQLNQRDMNAVLLPG
ncbi:hypothetical protein CGERO_05345 [Corynebacterium gerontici]|uniref:Uncharacterized protein n=1 Tax=Corynebacterium gerontici TaxID=2079234 RepID=A0A3G6J098_9CORY|nr:hypothetical protein CGERO_05345 [Corynebacterium gerontici]